MTCSILFPNPDEPFHDKINKMACASSEDSDQPGYPPSLIRVFAVRMKKPWVLSYPLSAQRRLWSDLGACPGWSESSLGAQSFCWFCHEAAQIKKHFKRESSDNSLSQLKQREQEPHRDKTNKMTCAPSDQPEHPPSLIREFAVHMNKAWAELPFKRTAKTLIRCAHSSFSINWMFIRMK